MKRRLPCLACGRMLAPFEFCDAPGCPAFAATERETPEPEVSTLTRVEGRPASITNIKPRLFED